MTAIKKRSLKISGHATSVSLEPEFWEELQAIAKAREISLNTLFSEIDKTREGRNLSSAARVYVLKTLKVQD